jgi:hypothetical protein
MKRRPHRKTRLEATDIRNGQDGGSDDAQTRLLRSRVVQDFGSQESLRRH